jgi:hypothetical protein
MPDALRPIYTRAGLASVVREQADGLQAQVVAIAVGRGVVAGAGRRGYEPAEDQTTLVAEMARLPILSAVRIGEVGFLVRCVAPASPEYPINEFGVVLSDGALLAIWSDPVAPLGYVTPYADIEIAFELDLRALPAQAVTVIVAAPDTPDQTGVLAELLAGLSRMTTETMRINERLRAANL